MAFWGRSFLIDGISSENLNLGITSFSTGTTESSAGAGVEIFNKKIYRKATPYFFGISQLPVLEFPLTIGSVEYVDAQTRNVIEKWLFGAMNYRKISIMESDLDDCYFNAMLLDPMVTYAGNLNIAYNCKISCDAPWAWMYPKTKTYTFPGNTIVSGSIAYYNYSADADYLYPTLAFTLNTVGNSFNLTNVTDNNRAFTFTSISASETITINNDIQTIVSSTGLYRIGNFNKKWFRLLPGQNIITYSGGIGSFSITSQFAKKVGG